MGKIALGAACAGGGLWSCCWGWQAGPGPSSQRGRTQATSPGCLTQAAFTPAGHPGGGLGRLSGKSAPEEEYIPATVEIDGEAFRQVGLRAKGNNSLRLTEEYGLSRYSLKLEFDHYTDGSYHGLDKLSLDASFQDNSYLKTWLAFDIMEFLGVPTPLRSFVWVTVNGQPWGLFLAGEEPEEVLRPAEFWGGPRPALQAGLPLPGRGERRRPPALHHRRARWTTQASLETPSWTHPARTASGWWTP